MWRLILAGTIVAVACVAGAMTVQSTGISAPAFRALTEEKAEAVVLQMSRDTDPAHAWRFLKEALLPNDILAASENNPHQLAHVLGQESYRQLGIDGISVCDQSFTFGCYHGFVRALIDDTGESADIVHACEKTPNVGGCAHGVGHALGTNDLTHALHECDVLFDTFNFSCWGGVFMEYIKTYTPPRVNDFWSLCMSVPAKYRLECAQGIPGRMSASKADDVAAECEHGSNDALRRSCADAFGSETVMRSGGDAQKINELCMFLAPTLRFDCYTAAARLVVQRSQANAERDAQWLCDHAPVDSQKCTQGFKDTLESLRQQARPVVHQ